MNNPNSEGILASFINSEELDEFIKNEGIT